MSLDSLDSSRMEEDQLCYCPSFGRLRRLDRNNTRCLNPWTQFGLHYIVHDAKIPHAEIEVLKRIRVGWHGLVSRFNSAS